MKKNIRIFWLFISFLCFFMLIKGICSLFVFFGSISIKLLALLFFFICFIISLYWAFENKLRATRIKYKGLKSKLIIVNEAGLLIYPSKIKTILLAFIALIFVILGFILVIYRKEITIDFWMNFGFNHKTANILSILSIIITSYIGIPFFGLGLFYILNRFLYPKPSVIINNEGIIDNSSLASVGLIKWDNISEIFGYNYLGNKFLGIIPKNINNVLLKQGKIKKFSINITKRLAKAPINISENTLPITIEELLSEINKYRGNEVKL